MTEKYVQITVGPNEFTDFDKFELEHPENIKPIFATNAVNHPGTGITLRTAALRVMYGGDRASQPKPLAGPKKCT